MAIVINGSGTVTGLAVGGLPDGTVDAGTLATNSVDSAKVADNAVGLAEMASGTDGNIISYDASGNPVAIATGSDGQVLTSTGAGSPPAFEAIPADGITHADVWRMGTDFTASSVSPVVNWVSNALTNVGHLGTAMSYSSGTFSFPVTGFWRIGLAAAVYKSVSDARQAEAIIRTTANNSSYSDVAKTDMNSIQGTQGSNTHASGYCEIILDISDLSNQKLQIGFSATDSVIGYGNAGRWNLTFTRLGDT